MRGKGGARLATRVGSLTFWKVKGPIQGFSILFITSGAFGLGVGWEVGMVLKEGGGWEGVAMGRLRGGKAPGPMAEGRAVQLGSSGWVGRDG